MPGPLLCVQRASKICETLGTQGLTSRRGHARATELGSQPLAAAQSSCVPLPLGQSTSQQVTGHGRDGTLREHNVACQSCRAIQLANRISDVSAPSLIPLASSNHRTPALPRLQTQHEHRQRLWPATAGIIETRNQRRWTHASSCGIGTRSAATTAANKASLWITVSAVWQSPALT